MCASGYKTLLAWLNADHARRGTAGTLKFPDPGYTGSLSGTSSILTSGTSVSSSLSRLTPEGRISRSPPVTPRIKKDQMHKPGSPLVRLLAIASEDWPATEPGQIQMEADPSA